MPDPHVQIDDTRPSVSYTVGVTASDGPFAITWAFFDEDTDIAVYIVDGEAITQLAANTYTVTGTSGYSRGYPGGTVTLDDAVSECTVVLEGLIPLERESDHTLGGALDINTVNTDADRTVAIAKEQRRDIDRSLRGPPGDDAMDALPRAALRALKYQGYDASGQPELYDSGLGELAATIATFQDRAAVEAAEINTALAKVIFVGGYAEFGDGGHGFYKLVDASTWSDGEIVDALDQIWQLILERGCVYAEQLGVVADGNLWGSTGTDNSAAIRRVIAAYDNGARHAIWPRGCIRFTETINIDKPLQAWTGQGNIDSGNNITEDTVAPSGTAFVYTGSGNRIAFYLNEGATWTQNNWTDLLITTGHEDTEAGARGCDVEWLCYADNARGTRWTHVTWRHRGASYEAGGTLPAESITGNFGCLRLGGEGSGKTWVHDFIACEWLTTCTRASGALGDTDNYIGYAWGADIAGNDIFMDRCHMNNASLITRNGGGYRITNSNFENGDWGSQADSDDLGTSGFDEPTTGRAAIIAVIAAGKTGVGGLISNTAISQFAYAVVLDSRPSPASVNGGFSMVNCHLRRNRTGEIRLWQNDVDGAYGGRVVGCTVTTYDDDEAEPEDSEGQGNCSLVRIVCTHDDDTRAKWPGFLVNDNLVYYPEVWDTVHGLNYAWWPRVEAPLASDPDLDAEDIDVRGIFPAVIGTPTSAAIVANTSGGGYPHITMTSAGGADDSAEIYGLKRVCARGSVDGVGGFFVRMRWQTPTVATDDRAFFGLMSTVNDISTAFPNDDPSDFEQMIGVGFDAGEETYHLIAGGASEQLHTDLGENFDATDTDAVWELCLWTAPFGNRYHMRMDRLDVGLSVRIQTDFSDNDGPAIGQRLTPHFWRNSAATASAVAVRLFSFECYAQPANFLGSPFSGIRTFA